MQFREIQTTFQGGDGRQHVTLDHPLYITDNREGGYDIKTEYDREQEKLFAGVESEFGMVRKFLYHLNL